MVRYAMSFEKNTISHTEVFRTKIIKNKVYHTAMLPFFLISSIKTEFKLYAV